jgi:quercetin dioxygenase-like cupin family protein
MRTVEPAGLPAASPPVWSDSGLAQLAARLAGEAGGGRAGWGRAGRAWSIPLLVTTEVEAWLLGWPAGLVTPAHGHRAAPVALAVLEGAIGEECLDPTIWTTSRRTTWRAGATTVFPAGHVHLLGAAGGGPAVAVHAWARSAAAGSADGGAGRPGPAGAAAAAGGTPGGGRGAAQPVGVGPGGGGHGCRRSGHAAHGALDLGHVGDGVAR